MDDPGPTRSLTIDRRRHARIVRDLVAEAARARLSKGWLLAAAAVVILTTAGAGHWYVGVGLLVTISAIQLLIWVIAALRATRQGLGVGQTVTVAHTDDSQLTVTDVTGQLFLPRGSVMLVRRTRGNVSVYGRSVTFVLPGELLSEADVAFLEGHGSAATGPEVPGPVLPLTLDVTQAMQDELVAQATRVVVGSADFLLPYVCALSVTALAAATRLWFLLAVTAFFLALALPGLFALGKLRRRFRLAYAVGRPVRAQVTAEHLTLSRRHGTVVLPWDRYTARRVTDRAVLLRIRRAPLTRTRTEVLPRALFRQVDLAQLATAVPRRF